MKVLFTALLLLGALAVVVKAVSNQRTNGKLNLGDAIPDVSAKDQDGSLVNLAQAGSSGYALIYFYPKAMTPGCTAQACSLRDAYTDLQAKGVKIFGVSLDKVDSQKKFQEKEHLPFVLLSDQDKKVTSAFGVPLILNSLATRQAYLFKNGKLVWMDTHASTDKQARDVLDVLSQQS
ncbi:MAG: peroxiredoxin [Verrucomicrobia bacterium]|nr:peroxiredoxin [Verrucomicrobiota bacterium]